MPPIIDLTTQKYGRLQPLEMVGRNRHRSTVWRCLCDCGNECVITSGAIRSGRATSCGCFAKEVQLTRQKTHGLSKSREYKIWAEMIRRCHIQKSYSYPKYGGRGIRVCDRWRRSFENFYADMGPRPSPKHSLDRKDNNGHYEPGNVHWATAVAQARNTRNNRFIEHEGRRLTLAEWSEESGIAYSTLRQRLKNGWSFARAVSAPLRGTA